MEKMETASTLKLPKSLFRRRNDNFNLQLDKACAQIFHQLGIRQGLCSEVSRWSNFLNSFKRYVPSILDEDWTVTVGRIGA